MKTEPQFKDAEERDISRGGKNTALLTVAIAVVVVAGGLATATLIRNHSPAPERPGTGPGTTPSGEVKPPSP